MVKKKTTKTKKKRVNPYRTKSVAVAPAVLSKLLAIKHILETKDQRSYSFSEVINYICDKELPHE